MYFREVVLHECLELLITSFCSYFIENRKCESFINLVLWDSTNLKANIIWYAIPVFCIFVVFRIYHRVSWLQIVRVTRFERILYSWCGYFPARTNESLLKNWNTDCWCPVSNILRIICITTRKSKSQFKIFTSSKT
jgi:hypothetical protein